MVELQDQTLDPSVRIGSDVSVKKSVIGANKYNVEKLGCKKLIR